MEGRPYYVLLVLCWIYAQLKGGVPERIGATIMALGSSLTMVAISSRTARFGSVELGVVIVDLVALVALIILALRAERFWPLWLTALQIIAIAGHAVKAAEPGTIPKAYAFAMAFWSYPMLLLIALGTWRHQQRLARNGADPSWSTSFGRSGPAPPHGPTG